MAEEIISNTDIAVVKKTNGKEYTVSKTDTYVCSCPAWTFSNPKKDCKYIKMVVETVADKEYSIIWNSEKSS